MKYKLTALAVIFSITSLSSYAQSESVQYQNIELCKSNTTYKQKDRCDLIEGYLEDTTKVTKLLNYPVIFVHGFLASYTKFRGLSDPEVSFQGVQELFRPLIKDSDRKQMVFQPSLLTAGSAHERGEMLINYINAVLAYTKKDKVHLIGHSQGSITSRYAAGQLCREDNADDCPIASVASIAGVNYGSTIADYMWKREREMEGHHKMLIPEYKSLWTKMLNAKFWNGASVLARSMNTVYEEDPFRTYVSQALKSSDLEEERAIYEKMNDDSKFLNSLRPMNPERLRKRSRLFRNLLSGASYIAPITAIYNFTKYSAKRSVENSIQQLTHPTAIAFNKHFPYGVANFSSVEDRVNDFDDKMSQAHEKHHYFDLHKIEAKHIEENGVFYASWSGNMDHQAHENSIKLKGNKLKNSNALAYKTLRPIFGITNNNSNKDQSYYQNQLVHDGMVANTDSKLGLDFGSYEGFNHSTIINNYSSFYKTQREYDNKNDAHNKAIDGIRQALDFSNPEYLYLNYISVLSLLEEHIQEGEIK
jgi:pimeloyl-ACP methyl ester carboxylesterase